ncbi:unnamed protein product [Amaranthus hypochondriacus]
MSTKGIRNKVRMRGFMCNSPVMCMSDDIKSVIVPGKTNYGIATTSSSIPRHRVTNNYYNNNNHLVKYSKLINNNNNNNNNNNKKEMEVLLPFGGRDDVMEEKKHQVLEVTSRASTHIFQVVVLRVSLHCQGCAGKVRRHLSRMQGVTSFSIDLETKRVTVMGNVSPSRVLESISKVKKAEFWNC